MQQEVSTDAIFLVLDRISSLWSFSGGGRRRRFKKPRFSADLMLSICYRRYHRFPDLVLCGIYPEKWSVGMIDAARKYSRKCIVKRKVWFVWNRWKSSKIVTDEIVDRLFYFGILWRFSYFDDFSARNVWKLILEVLRIWRRTVCLRNVYAKTLFPVNWRK